MVCGHYLYCNGLDTIKYRFDSCPSYFGLEAQWQKRSPVKRRERVRFPPSPFYYIPVW